MRSAFRVVFLLLALVASEAFAQQSVVFSVDGWPRMSTRDDGKIPANTFTWGVLTPATVPAGAAAASGRPAVQDAVLVFPLGDAALLFTQNALRGTHLPSVLVEFPLAKVKPGGPAPFAVRLTEVFVTSVTMSKSGNDGGPGLAEVKLAAAKIEFFTSNQDPRTGALTPGRKAGFEVRGQKVY